MIPRDKRTAENWCGHFNKQRHKTKEAALKHRSNLLRNPKKDHSRTNALKCGICDGWHVGRR